MNDSTSRFSDRVENYIKYRPTYPAEVLELLRTKCDLGEGSTVADIGSGTGILTRLLLENGNKLFAVEPNAEMRAAAERLLEGFPELTSVPATAEHTGLADHLVDLVVAAQAFHWFDMEKCRAEFLRILKPGGWVCLVWNERLLDSTPFLRAYENLLQKHATDYTVVDHRNVGGEALAAFFGRGAFAAASFPNLQTFDFDGLKGRCLSSSYAPNEGAPGYDAMLAELREIFDRHQRDGVVFFEYTTNVYYGRLAAHDARGT